MAIEDIGLADPRALRIALDACETYERLGSPEGELALAEAVDLPRGARPRATRSTSPTTRRARSSPKDGTRPVPLHLRNAPTKLMKNLGYGKDYRYAHDEDGGLCGGRELLSRGHGAAAAGTSPTERGLEGEDPREARRTCARWTQPAARS